MMRLLRQADSPQIGIRMLATLLQMFEDADLWPFSDVPSWSTGQALPALGI